jgi:hypothetical protein
MVLYRITKNYILGYEASYQVVANSIKKQKQVGSIKAASFDEPDLPSLKT